MKKYSWKYGTYGGADAQLVGEELEIIERKGELTNQNVLDYAKRHKDSELHKCFEWDDTIAGELFRKHQASHIISHIAYIVEDDPQSDTPYKQKVYVSLASDIDNKNVYKNFSKVLQDDDDYEKLLQKCRDQLSRVKKDYERLLNREDLKELFFNMYTNI